MYKARSHKTKQFFFVLIKLSIVFGAFYFIYNKLTSNTELQFSEFLVFLKENDAFSIKNALILVFLSIFNWFFEILKWQKLVFVVRKLSFFEALKQSLSALTASLFTPNRIGDYGAKALYYKLADSKRIVLLNFIGNMQQMAVTTVFGLIGLYFFVTQYAINIPVRSVSRYFVIVISITLFSVFGFKKQNKFGIKGFSVEKIIAFVKTISLKNKLYSFLFSLIRYLIFSFQFYYLLVLFKIDISIYNAFISITSMYFLASIVPTIFIFDVLIKGSVAVFVFSKIGVNNFTILSVVLAMWILNFVLPSILGSYFVLQYKLPKPVK
ncbi:MAG: hypothetical protein ACPG6B_01025 [Oceanihabitans sp.]